MKKRKMMALLTAAAVMCSLAVPALADEAEGDLIPITFCGTGRSSGGSECLREYGGSDLREEHLDRSYCGEIRLRGFLSLGRIQLRNCNAEV